MGGGDVLQERCSYNIDGDLLDLAEDAHAIIAPWCQHACLLSLRF